MDGSIMTICCTADNQFFFTGDDTGTVLKWSRNDEKIFGKFEQTHQGGVNLCATSACGNFLWTTDFSGEL
jgi:hypothetical protein